MKALNINIFLYQINIQTLNFFLILAFFIHGILYFVYPIEIDNPSSPIKYIKYILIIMYAALNISYLKATDTIYLLTFISVTFLFYFMNASIGLQYIYILFVLPISFAYLYRHSFRRETITKAALYAYIIIAVFAYAEFFFFHNIFVRFGVGEFGYRLSSILVNPNNFGITTFFLFLFLDNTLAKRSIKYILLINTIVILSFSMSKTAFLLLTLYLVYKHIRISMVIVSLCGLVSIFIVSDLEINEKYIASSVIRGSLNNDFLILAEKNFLLPFYNSYQYTDNIYFQLWGFFGLFFLILFLLLNQLLIITFFKRKESIFALTLLFFLLAGITTNYLYLWPLSYMYWGFVFYTLRGSNNPCPLPKNV